MAFALACLAACSVVPPQPPAPRTALPVSASAGKTWDAVIDVFAERNISIKTLDRSSGLIVAERQEVTYGDARALADCGATMSYQIPASAAFWNVLVRGDSAHATVKATVRFTNGGGEGTGKGLIECSSRGVLETALEGQVKAAAEGKTASR